MTLALRNQEIPDRFVPIERGDEVVRDFIEYMVEIDDGENMSCEWLKDISYDYVRDHPRYEAFEEEGEELELWRVSRELVRASGLEGDTFVILMEQLQELGWFLNHECWWTSPTADGIRKASEGMVRTMTPERAAATIEALRKRQADDPNWSVELDQAMGREPHKPNPRHDKLKRRLMR